jgi:aspartate/methionine/tyrosine aminotransferase
VSAGDEVVLPAPYFTNHYMQVQASGAHPIEAPVADQRSYRLTWNDIAPALTSRTRAVVLCNPSNPTGAPIAAVEGQRIVTELAAARHRRDQRRNLHAVRVRRRHWSAASVADWRRNVVVIGTFSKSFALMGWRVGFVLADRRGLRTGHEDPGRDDHLRADDLADGRRGRALATAGDYRAGFHREFVRRRQLVADRIAAIRRCRGRRPAPVSLRSARVDGCTGFNGARLAPARGRARRHHPGCRVRPSGEGCLRLSFGSVSSEDLVEGLDRLERFSDR